MTFKLIWSLLSVAGKLARMFRDWNIRRQVRTTCHDEQITKQLQKLRKANEARRQERRAVDMHPDQWMQDDGFRRD